MKKIISLLLISLCFSVAYGSKLSKYLNKLDAEEKARMQHEWQQDMNFADMSFRLDRRYVRGQGDNCRDYVFRSRSNPYRSGAYTVCDERASSYHGHGPEARVYHGHGR